jgi:hypothetical protein
MVLRPVSIHGVADRAASVDGGVSMAACIRVNSANIGLAVCLGLRQRMRSVAEAMRCRMGLRGCADAALDGGSRACLY